MRSHDSRHPRGYAPACTCGARPVTNPITGVPSEDHAQHCGVLEASRARRARDLAALAARPTRHVLLRPVDPSEVDEIADAAGTPVPTSRRARRRWTVQVTRQSRAGTVALTRVVLVDGVPVAALVDETPAMAGAA